MRPLFVRRSLWHRLPTRVFGMVASITALGSLAVLWLSAR